jgi:hypothetical protein
MHCYLRNIKFRDKIESLELNNAEMQEKICRIKESISKSEGEIASLQVGIQRNLEQIDELCGSR